MSIPKPLRAPHRALPKPGSSKSESGEELAQPKTGSHRCYKPWFAPRNATRFKPWLTFMTRKIGCWRRFYVCASQGGTIPTLAARSQDMSRWKSPPPRLSYLALQARSWLKGQPHARLLIWFSGFRTGILDCSFCLLVFLFGYILMFARIVILVFSDVSYWIFIQLKACAASWSRLPARM